MNELIYLNHVDVTYPEGTVALRDANLQIDDGEFLFVIGQSGAGKSTVLKLISRQVLPTKGQVLIDGKSLSRMKRSEIYRYRRRIGVVFQDFKLLPNKTVFENVAYALEVIESPPGIIMPKVTKALELVGLIDKADCLPDHLSGGEQQRTSIARAIVNDPDILIADEPTGNLDPVMSRDVMQLIEEINLRGTTVIVATHNRSIVDEMRKRVVCLNKGRIIRDEPKGLYFDEAENN